MKVQTRRQDTATVATSVTKVIGANPRRHSISLVNQSSATVYVTIGSTQPAVGGAGYRIQAAGTLQLTKADDGDVVTQEIYAIADGSPVTLFRHEMEAVDA